MKGVIYRILCSNVVGHGLAIETLSLLSNLLLAVLSSVIIHYVAT
jgi:hypothetical protein